MRARSLHQEDPLEKEMVTHSSVFSWDIPRTEEPGGLQSIGSQESDMTKQLNHLWWGYKANLSSLPHPAWCSSPFFLCGSLGCPENQGVYCECHENPNRTIWERERERLKKAQPPLQGAHPQGTQQTDTRGASFLVQKERLFSHSWALISWGWSELRAAGVDPDQWGWGRQALLPPHQADTPGRLLTALLCAGTGGSSAPRLAQVSHFVRRRQEWARGGKRLDISSTRGLSGPPLIFLDGGLLD